MNISLILKECNKTNTYNYKCYYYKNIEEIENILTKIDTEYTLFLGENELLSKVPFELKEDVYYFDYFYNEHYMYNSGYGYFQEHNFRRNVFLETLGIQHALFKTSIIKEVAFKKSLVYYSHHLVFKNFNKINFPLLKVNSFSVTSKDIDEFKIIYDANILNGIYIESDNEFYTINKYLLKFNLPIYKNKYENTVVEYEDKKGETC